MEFRTPGDSSCLDVRYVRQEQIVEVVVPGWRQFVTQAQGQSQFRRHLPRVVRKSRHGVPLKFGLGQSHGHYRIPEIAQQEIGEGVASFSVRTHRRIRLERKLAARELVADLIEVLASVFETEAEAVLAACPGNVVDQLKRIVVDGKRTVLRIADGDEAGPAKEAMGTPHATGGRSRDRVCRCL